ncbi:MAG: hypothetical protein IIC02_10055 [Planctomycetes bacterium]|nr:hypothetical protein [Planctomycetota bacterium]
MANRVEQLFGEFGRRGGWRAAPLFHLCPPLTLAMVGGGVGIVFGLAIGNAASLYPDMVPITVPIWVISIANSRFFRLTPGERADANAIIDPQREFGLLSP